MIQRIYDHEHEMRQAVLNQWGEEWTRVSEVRAPSGKWISSTYPTHREIRDSCLCMNPLHSGPSVVVVVVPTYYYYCSSSRSSRIATEGGK